jgi:AraC family transcriptional regulator
MEQAPTIWEGRPPRIIDSSMFGAPIDIDLSAFGLKFNAMGMALTSLPPGEVEIHYQGACDFIEIDHGSIGCRSGFNSDEIKNFGNILPGATTFVPVGATIRGAATNISPNLVILLEREKLIKIVHESGYLKNPSFEPFFWRDDQVVSDISRHLIQEVRKEADHNRLFIENLAIALVARVLNFLPKAKPGSLPSGGEDFRIKRAIEYAHSNLGESLEIADMAAAASLSPFHFLRCFKSVTGETPHAFVTRARIERAENLLRTSPLSLVDVALVCGFSSQAHFTTSFGKSKGTTPAKYRKSLH